MKKSSNSLAVSLAALVCALAVTTTQAQTAESPLQFERGFPTAVTAEKAHYAADLRRAIEAYKFFFPTRAPRLSCSRCCPMVPRSTKSAT